MTMPVPLQASRSKTLAGNSRRIHVVQGEFHVSSDPECVMTTILGSCVSACIRDPHAGIGGMNHFLLPGTSEPHLSSQADREAVHAMELLVNALLARGARRARLEAKLFGGARLIDGLTDIGRQNAVFAERFLAAESIDHVGGSLRGELGRKIQFWPVSGRARQSLMERGNRQIFETEKRTRPVAPVSQNDGSVELF